MDLTNKVTYLLTEYQTKCHPQVVELTTYANTLKSLTTPGLIGSSFTKLKAETQTALTNEVDELRQSMLSNLKPKILALGTTLATKGTALLVTNKDHVVDMSENVDDDARIGEGGAQTDSLKTTITGMSAITPGGGAGAAVVTAENAPTLIQLAEKTAAKVVQVAAATKELPTLATSAVELTKFASLLKTLA